MYRPAYKDILYYNGVGAAFGEVFDTRAVGDIAADEREVGERLAESLDRRADTFREAVRSGDCGNVQAFVDERADMAAERLIDYLKRYMERSEKGADDPMYQMAMTLLERNKMGDLDYKSISKLYELEDKFDGEYADIMRLFKEANVVQRNAVNYYFWKRNPANGVWMRVEPSFCRM